MKKLYLFAALAAMLAACSENDLTKETAVQQNAEEGAVQFSAYMSRGTTRAGAPGTLTTAATGTDAKRIGLQNEGFGVLAYYNDGEPYSENSKPDFMYNQQVTYSGGSWQYNPVKYWPNEFGSDAISEGTDRLTFFAYAPYVEVDLTTGLAKVREGKTEEATTGIIALTRNTTHGDPFVKYYADFNPDKRVDLCWGVAKDNFNSSVSGVNTNNIKKGDPYIDVVKPDVSSKIFFDFKHALAALNVTIDADIDEAGHGTNGYVDGFTKIWVRSITFEGFTDKGMLNLNGSAIGAYTPEWYDLSGNNKIGSGGKTSIYDGLRDGSEPLSDASNETPAALNPQIIQSYPYVNTAAAQEAYNTGLTTTPALTGVPSSQPVNLFNSTTASEPIYVIPTNDYLKVTIVYDVETADKNLTNYLADGAVRGSCVENKITKEIMISGSKFKLQAGKLYTIALHLGMTSVKFDASVTGWDVEVPADDTWLPANAPTATVTAGGTAGTLNLEAEGLEKGNLLVGGLTPGNAVTVTPTGANVHINSNSSKADVNGKANVVFTVDHNNDISDILTGMSIVVTDGSKTGTLNITQKAHALGLTVRSVTNNTIQLQSGASAITWNKIKTISVSRKNRSDQTQDFTKADDVDNNKFKFLDGLLTFKSPAQDFEAGDVYTITVSPESTPGSNNDAPEEVVTVKIGGIAFAQDAYSIEYGYAGFNPTPVYYGLMPSGYTYTQDVNTYATVDGTSGVITTVAADASATTEITATATQADGNGYLCTTKSKQASYNLTVTPATGTISYALNDVTSTIKTAGYVVKVGGEDLDLGKAVLKNSRGDVLTANASNDADEDAGVVTYTIVSVNGTTGTAPFAALGSDNLLTIGSADLAAGTYTILVRATVDATGNGNVTYSDSSEDATFILTVE